MNTQQITDFVKQEISKGGTKERIAQVLRINGVSQAEIDQALSNLADTPPIAPPPTSPPPPPVGIIPPSMTPTPTPTPMPTPQAKPPQKSHGGLIALVIIVLLLIGAGGASAYVYMFQPELIKNLPILDEFLFPTPTPEEAMTKIQRFKIQ